LGLFAFSLIVLSLLEKAKEGNTLVWYYIISVSVYIVFGLFEMFAHSGIYLFSNYYLSNYGLHTGLIVEAIILLYGLANQFNEYRKEKEQLLVAINKKQEEITVKVFETQELERKKIADQLHDEVGSLLSVVSLNISSLIEKNQGHPKAEGKLQSAFEAIVSAASLVRNISHTLTPIAIEKYGFKRAVDNLIASINTSEKLKIEYVVIGFEQTDRYSIVLLNDIFRSIQEMMSNVIRHSGASHAYLELIEHEELITMMIEDNGKGMPEQDKFKKGNGLDNIFSRINYFKGKIEINSQPESGTLIVIEIPTNQH
jgi:signal transduction histidine kinase